MAEITTINEQGVAVGRSTITVLVPKRVMSKEEARRFAAWLVVLSDTIEGESPEFGDIMEAIQKT